MVSTANDFFSWAGGLINNTSIFQAGSNFVVILLAMLVIAVLISPKKPRNWLKLFLPILVWFRILGLNVKFMFLIITGILFVIETMSLEVMGGILQAGSEKVKEIIEIPKMAKKKKADKMMAKAEREYKWDKYRGVPIGTTRNERLFKEEINEGIKGIKKKSSMFFKDIDESTLSKKERKAVKWLRNKYAEEEEMRRFGVKE